MSDYISREAVLEMLKQECSPMVFAYLADLVNDIPTADVRPVVRGKWDDDGCGWVRCSICRGAIAVARGGNRFNFCPNCGADMREES